MSEFDKINNKVFQERTAIEKVIVWFCEYDQNEYPIKSVSIEAERAAAELAALRARVEELKKALDKSNKYLAETLAYAKFPNHAYSLTVSNIERRIRHNNDILNQQS